MDASQLRLQRLSLLPFRKRRLRRRPPDAVDQRRPKPTTGRASARPNSRCRRRRWTLCGRSLCRKCTRISDAVFGLSAAFSSHGHGPPFGRSQTAPEGAERPWSWAGRPHASGLVTIIAGRHYEPSKISPAYMFYRASGFISIFFYRGDRHATRLYSSPSSGPAQLKAEAGRGRGGGYSCWNSSLRHPECPTH